MPGARGKPGARQGWTRRSGQPLARRPSYCGMSLFHVSRYIIHFPSTFL